MEGPSILILAEELAPFVNRKIEAISGNSKQDIQTLSGKKIKAIKSWGKLLLIQFNNVTLRVHFLLFGSYRINEHKPNASPRLSLSFNKGEINFYSCSVKLLEGDPFQLYDPKFDLMSKSWDESFVFDLVKKQKQRMICDVLLDQEIFAGLGNIIKNEVLFNLHLQPETLVEALTAKQIKGLVKEARDYSFRFYEWKKIYELKKHWQIYRKKTCPRCGIPVIIRKTGKVERKTYYCAGCQRLLVNSFMS